MAPQATGKNLRVALIQGPKIVEDRTLKKRVAVSVGQNATNTFVVPVSNLPPSFTLFEVADGAYQLCFTAEMDGKVLVKGAEVTLEQARSQGLAKPRKGNVFQLPLTDASKGRVVLGEVTLLFQFVTPPPEPPKVELPPNIRGTLIDQGDRFFFTVAAVSLFLHFSGAAYIVMQPMPEEREVSLEELPDRFIKTMMPEAKPPPAPKVADKGGDKPDKKTEEAKADDKPKPATTNADKRAALNQKVASAGLLKVIGSASGGGGAFEDVLGSSSGAGDVAAALSGASGVGVATADALGAAGPKGGAAGKAADIGALGTSGGGNVTLGAKGDATIRGGVSMQAPEVESGAVDREKLASYVRGRKMAIQQCYEKELKRNPSLKGKIVVRFTISTAGRATEIDIEENSLNNEAVASCIKTVIRGWVFPFKPPSDVPVAYPFVFAPAT
jgi:hypothetical protein